MKAPASPEDYIDLLRINLGQLLDDVHTADRVDLEERLMALITLCEEALGR